MDFLKIGLDIIVGYFALIILTSLLGKTQLSQITAFDFISAVVIGELVGNALFDEKTGVWEILFAITLWGLLVFATDIITQKFRRTRKILEGSPSILINNGVIDFEALKKNHLNINQLQHLLRQKDIFSIKDCAYAILETDGSLSALKVPGKENVTREDLNIPAPQPSLPVAVVMDGEIIKDNLTLVGWDEAKLQAELTKQGVSRIEDVLFAEWMENAPLHIQLRDSGTRSNNNNQ